jgi:predicted ribosomally synthesized peptide with SipW-like signal peptide
MTRKDIELSRRKILAGIGAAGVASVGAGMGTSAYFSDTESFENNTLTAGELDLKVDWQQTYNGPNPGNDGIVEQHPVNAYPDTTGDGLQDLDGVRYSGAGEVEPVFDAADVPACCDCGPDEYYLTYGGETYCIEPLSGDGSVEEFYDYDSSSGVYSSLNDGIQRADTTFVFLYEDGDGELSLVIVNDDRENENGGSAASVTIEGAPSGMNWLAGGTTGDDNWIVKDDQEGDPGSGFDQYETAEANWVWTDNRTDGGAIGTLADDFALRLSASLNDAADLSGSPARGNGQIEDFVVLSGGSGLGAGSQEISLETEIREAENNEVGPITIHSACGIDSGSQLDTPAVFQSENYPDQEHLIELGDVKPGDMGEITFSLHLCDNPGYIWLTASNFTDGPGETPEPEPTPDDGELAANTMVRIWYDEDCDNEHDDEEVLVFGPGVGGYTDFDGNNPATLAAAMEVIGAGSDSEGMIPLDGDASSPMEYDDGPTANSRDCLPGGTGMCVGVEWWVPTAVGNGIQGDEVSFDLGFYTEQCRHNDGSGNNEAAS